MVECVYCRLSGVVYTNLGQPYHEGVVTDGIVVDHRYLILGSFFSCTSNHDWKYVAVCCLDYHDGFVCSTLGVYPGPFMLQ